MKDNKEKLDKKTIILIVVACILFAGCLFYMWKTNSWHIIEEITGPIQPTPLLPPGLK